MLKKGIVFLWVFMLVPLVYAEQEIVDIEFIKEQYSPGETVQMRLITEPLEKPLKPEQLALYVNGIKKPIAPFFTRYTENTYLLYFDLPLLIDGPTYFKVEKILYRGSAGLQEYIVEKEISINNESNLILSVIPAFVVLEKNQEEFQIQVENKQASIMVNISATQGIDHVYNTPQTLNQNGRRIFKFSVDRSIIQSNAVVTLEYDTTMYTVPIMQRQAIIEQPSPQTTEQPKLLFLAAKPEVRQTIKPTVILAGTLSLMNQGNSTLENISLAFIGNIKAIASIDTTTIPSLQPQQSLDITLTINQNRDAVPSLYEGILQATTATTTASFPITVKVEEETALEPSNQTINLELEKEQQQSLDENPLKINLTKKGVSQQTTKEYPIGLIIVTFFILGVAITLYVLKRKKPVKEETFDEYIKKIRK